MRIQTAPQLTASCLLDMLEGMDVRVEIPASGSGIIVFDDAGEVERLDLWRYLNARACELETALHDRQAIEQLLGEIGQQVRHA